MHVEDLSGEPGTFLACPNPNSDECAWSEWSADPGDYFWLSPADHLLCGCGERLAEYRRTTSVSPV